ncbi:2-C-methyl-D-erythritol 2,4-cyclodiphosphate synthase [Nesterenkonia sp. K-15-9-6]|uniref:2-C-methyl-D-erythritol 2,4-cyclodiphosphate synthase n=1 Tax=Nesterenkonia sp. K-15-9-6 TaxID=3093918 RepID=UPI004043D732
MGPQVAPAETKRPDAEQHRALVIVAAGSGQRLGHGIPKALVELGGRPLLARALDSLGPLRAPGLGIDLVVLVLPGLPPARERLAALGAEHARRAGIPVIVRDGGPSRPASVARGVDAVAEQARHHGWDERSLTVLVHDAARPLTPADVAERVARQVEAGSVAVVPAVPVTDTIKRVDPAGRLGHHSEQAEQVRETLPRAELRAVQTPQGFTLEFLLRAFAHLGELKAEEAEALTDEAMVAEALGVDVAVVSGDARALKITTPADLLAAEALLAEHGSEPSSPGTDPAGRPPAVVVPRVGIGHDVHAVASAGEPRELWLAGLHWPGEQGLTGHSDGDAVAHAACDALFSAAGVGDLGVHFGADTLGTDREDMEGASGVRLLEEAARIVREAGFEIGSISVQFVARRPKFGPRREEAQRVLSAAAGAPVALSATTSDGLGFTGRGEGVLATATAVLIPQSPSPAVS